MANTFEKVTGWVGASKIFGAGKKPPTITPPAVMPTADGESVEAARRRKLLEMQARMGRASTIFTGQDDQGIGG